MDSGRTAAGSREIDLEVTDGFEEVLRDAKGVRHVRMVRKGCADFELECHSGTHVLIGPVLRI